MSTSIKLADIIDQVGKDLVIIHFWANWSGSAFMMNNILKDLIPTYEEKVGLLEIDVEEDPEIVASLSITEIPTLVFFNTENHSLEGIFSGMISKHRLKSELNAVLSRIQSVS